MIYDYATMKEVAKILTKQIDYAEHHNQKDLDLLYEMVDSIADLLSENEEDYYDFYRLCNVISPDQRDENAIS